MIGHLVAGLVASASPDLSFMVGEWLACSPKATVEEHWVAAGDDGLVGLTVTRRGAQGSFEHARVARAGEGWAFYASPGGATPTLFRLVKAGPEEAVFENPDHDFPKRVSYRRDGSRLIARATDLADEGPTWTYRPRAEGPCPGG